MPTFSNRLTSAPSSEAHSYLSAATLPTPTCDSAHTMPDGGSPAVPDGTAVVHATCVPNRIQSHLSHGVVQHPKVHPDTAADVPNHVPNAPPLDAQHHFHHQLPASASSASASSASYTSSPPSSPLALPPPLKQNKPLPPPPLPPAASPTSTIASPAETETESLENDTQSLSLHTNTACAPFSPNTAVVPRTPIESYKPKSILITGGAGFIGSHVVDLLVARYPTYRIIILDKLDYCAALENISPHFSRRNLVWCRGDIRSKCLVDYLLRSESVDTIMNFAASTHVDNSFHSSISFTSNNVVGTHVLLEAAREYGSVRRFIHVSTDEVYGGETDFEKEEAMLSPTNPYACTKAAAELICRGYAKSFDMPIIITRGNNVYGPRQYPDKLIAKTCCLLARRQPAFIHGNGSHLRNYVYVTDMAEAFDVILHKGKVGGVYNVGSDVERTNLQVVRDCVRACGLSDARDKNAFISFVKDREVNDHHYRIDSTKLRLLGWQSRVSWDEGIQLTTKWFADEQNLKRWPDFTRGLVAHPSLEGSTKEEALM